MRIRALVPIIAGLLCLTCWSQTDPEKSELATIVTRAQDSKNPQSPSVTTSQLDAWATKFGGSIEHIDVPVSGRVPTPRALVVCKSQTVKGTTCTLVSASQKDAHSPMTCTYACKKSTK